MFINFIFFLFFRMKNIPVNINIEFKIIDKNLILKPNWIRIDVKKEKKATEIIGYWKYLIDILSKFLSILKIFDIFSPKNKNEEKYNKFKRK